jgi:predicted nucleic acid-binding protein
MSVVVADSSALYALFAGKDTHHSKALQEVARADEVEVPAEIYSEFLGVVHRRHGYRRAVEAAEDVARTANVRLVDSTAADRDAAWEVFLEARGELSYPDSIVVSRCRRARSKPLAFDKNIAWYASARRGRRK